MRTLNQSHTRINKNSRLVSFDPPKFANELAASNDPNFGIGHSADAGACTTIKAYSAAIDGKLGT